MAKKAETLSPFPIFAGKSKRDIESRMPKKFRALKNIKRVLFVWPCPMAKTFKGPTGRAILRRRRAGTSWKSYECGICSSKRRVLLQGGRPHYGRPGPALLHTAHVSDRGETCPDAGMRHEEQGGGRGACQSEALFENCGNVVVNGVEFCVCHGYH